MTRESVIWNSRTITIVVLMFCLLIASFPAQGSRADFGIVFGRVYDDTTKDPIEGAYVMLAGNGSYVNTDKAGDFAMPGVLYGDYEIWAYKEGYMASHSSLTVDEQAETLSFYLVPEAKPVKGLLKGKVVLERPTEENNVTAAAITIKSWDVPGADELFVPVDGTWDTGFYHAALAPGLYSVSCGAPGHVNEIHSQVIVDSGVVTYEDFYLKAFNADNPSLEGYTKDLDTGQGIPNATVIAYGMASGHSITTNSDGRGRYHFQQIPPGDYVLAAMAEGHEPGEASVTVFQGEWNEANIILKGTSSALLWGLVLGEGVPLDYGWVFTEGLLGARSDLFGVPGLYALFPFPGGVSQKVIAWASKHYPDSRTLTVPAGSIKRQDFHLKYSGEGSMDSLVLMRVLKEPEMVPLGGASLSLYHTDPYTGTIDIHRTIDLAPDENMWMVYPVPVGTDYTLKCVHAGLVLTGYDLNGISMDPDDDFDVDSGTPALIDLKMNGSILPPHGNCTIWGHIVLDLLGGFPLSDADVLITPYSGPIFRTGTSGRYEYHVDPGTYHLLPAYPGAYNIAPYDHDHGWWGIGSYPVVLYPGETRHIDFVLSVRGGNSSIHGQVMYNSTLEPVVGFEIMASSAERSLPYVTTWDSGHFMFTPIGETGITWTLIGGYSLNDVVRVEYRTMPTGPWTSTNTWPVSFELPPSAVIYVNVYVDPIGPNDLNSSVIWGYVHRETHTGEILPDALITLWPYGGEFHYSGEDGFYSYEVPHGDYLMQAVYPGMEHMHSLDLATGTWGIWLWVGTLAPGESRHVDIIITFSVMEGATIAGRVLNAADNTVVHGYPIKAFTDTTILPVQHTVRGFFTFTPLTDLDAPWSVVGDSSGYSFVRAESRLVPSGSAVPSSEYPIVNDIASGNLVWIDIYVNRTTTLEPVTVDGLVLELYTYDPVPDVEVVAVPTLELGTLISSTTTDEDGAFKFELKPGEYTIMTKGPEFASPGVTLTIMPDSDLDLVLFMPPEDLVPGLTTKMKFVEGKKVVSGVDVQIGGIGDFTSDMSGSVSFLLGYRGNYTVTISREVLSIVDSNGITVPVRSDGKLYLVPGESYTVGLKEVKGTVKTKEAALDDPLSIGLMAIAVIAFIVGLAVGYSSVRKPKPTKEE